MKSRRPDLATPEFQLGAAKNCVAVINSHTPVVGAVVVLQEGPDWHLAIVAEIDHAGNRQRLEEDNYEHCTTTIDRWIALDAP